MNDQRKHRRIIVTHYGGPEELRVLEEERPEPMPGEVLVKVLAAGISLPDIMMREGIHPETPTLPFTPGWDLVGVVERLGNGVTGLEPGQIVAARRSAVRTRSSSAYNNVNWFRCHLGWTTEKLSALF